MKGQPESRPKALAVTLQPDLFHSLSWYARRYEMSHGPFWLIWLTSTLRPWKRRNKAAIWAGNGLDLYRIKIAKSPPQSSLIISNQKPA